MKNFKENIEKFYAEAERAEKQIKQSAETYIDDLCIEIGKYRETNNQVHLKHAQDAYKRIKAVRAYMKSL